MPFPLPGRYTNALAQSQQQQRAYPTPPFAHNNEFQDNLFAVPPNAAAQQGLGFDYMGSQEQYLNWLSPRLMQRYQDSSGGAQWHVGETSTDDPTNSMAPGALQLRPLR